MLPLKRTSILSLPADGLSALPRAIQWAILIVLSAALATLLNLTGLPAALFLGPMVAGVLVGINGGIVRVPRPAYFGAQGVMGCLIATSINPQIIGTFLHEWPIFIGVVLSIVTASSFLGWLMSRWQVLPGTTSVWGSWPGAASAMVVMAEAFGADARLVAFMQYLRVACVAGLASIVAAIWVHKTGTAHPAVSWFPTLHWLAFSETLMLAAGGAIAGRLLKITSGSMLIPMLVGGVLHVTGAIEIELPRWLLAGTYALLGWNVGLGFTPAILAHAWRALPKIFASIVVLISFSGFLAYVLTKTLGIDPLTAYLATSPGGMDSVAIIAASSNVDISFVMALQTIRFFIIVLIGPPLARIVARRLETAAGPQEVSRS